MGVVGAYAISGKVREGADVELALMAGAGETAYTAVTGTGFSGFRRLAGLISKRAEIWPRTPADLRFCGRNTWIGIRLA